MFYLCSYMLSIIKETNVELIRLHSLFMMYLKQNNINIMNIECNVLHRLRFIEHEGYVGK